MYILFTDDNNFLYIYVLFFDVLLIKYFLYFIYEILLNDLVSDRLRREAVTVFHEYKNTKLYFPKH